MTVFENERQLVSGSKAPEYSIPTISSSYGTVVQRDPRESVVISPPSIASVPSTIAQAKDVPTSNSPGIGVNIHRSKQGVFVVRLNHDSKKDPRRIHLKPALCRSVHPGGLAANSKRIRPGDILVSLNDQAVEGKTLVEVHNVIQVVTYFAMRHVKLRCNVGSSRILSAKLSNSVS